MATLLEITSETRDGYLFLAASGEVTQSSILNLGTEVRQRCDSAGLEGVIIDCREMCGALSVGELFTVTQQFCRIVGPAISVAYINRPAEWDPVDDQFSRDVAINRGGSLEVFESERQAAEWLLERNAG